MTHCWISAKRISQFHAVTSTKDNLSLMPLSLLDTSNELEPRDERDDPGQTSISYLAVIGMIALECTPLRHVIDGMCPFSPFVAGLSSTAGMNSLGMIRAAMAETGADLTLSMHKDQAQRQHFC